MISGMAEIDKAVVATPDEAPEVERVLEILEVLSERASPHGRPPLLLLRDGDREVSVPPSLIEALRRAAEKVARGEAIAVVPIESDLTTQQAADLLNVSRPHLIDKILAGGDIPFHMVGNRRRLRLSDVLRYKRERDRARGAALEELTAESERLGLRRF
jgi:excisionase family DNA binding protein